MPRRSSPTERAPAAGRCLLRADLDRVPDHASLWAPSPCDADDARATSLRALVATALTARQRDIVEWHFFEGLSQGAIARRLGVTQQVVQKALYGDARRGRRVGGALRRLRDALERAESA